MVRVTEGCEVQAAAWFPWLKFEAGVEADRTNTTGQQEAESITLEPVESATRQLVELSLHYLVNQPERIWFRGFAKAHNLWVPKPAPSGQMLCRSRLARSRVRGAGRAGLGPSGDGMIFGLQA